MSSSPLLQTHELTKDFGSDRGAIGINIQINPGEIVGFVGPNGAGKTTTINMLTGLIHRDSGDYWLFGNQISSLKDLQHAFAKIGFLPSEPAFYPMTSLQLFDYAEKLYGEELTTRALGLSDILELDVKRPIRNLSLGNRKKAGIVQALMHNPQLVIMDEPTSGLDPLIQQRVLEMLKQVRAAGGAVFLSSHTLSEVESVCDRIIMIKSSRIIIQDTTKNILNRALKKFRINALPPKLLPALQKLAVRADNQRGDLVLYTQNVKPILDLLHQQNIYNFYLERTSLEEMFLAEYDL